MGSSGSPSPPLPGPASCCSGSTTRRCGRCRSVSGNRCGGPEPRLPQTLTLDSGLSGDSGEGTGDGERHSQAPASPTSHLLQVKPASAAPPGPSRPRRPGTWLHLRSACLCALPAGSAGDRFPRQPRGKNRPGCVRGEQTRAQGGRLRAVTV